MSQPLRSAYISIVIATQLARPAATQAGGGRAGVGAAGDLGLVDEEPVRPVFDLHVVDEALATAGDDPHRPSRSRLRRPSNRTGSSTSAKRAIA